MLGQAAGAFQSSTAISTTYAAGTPMSNYLGNPVTTDNLMYQLMKRTESAEFKGSTSPWKELLWDSSESRSFTRFTPTSWPKEDCFIGCEKDGGGFFIAPSSPTTNSMYSNTAYDTLHHDTGNKNDALHKEKLLQLQYNFERNVDDITLAPSTAPSTAPNLSELSTVDSESIVNAPINVTFVNDGSVAGATTTDWIGIYAEGADPMKNSSLLWMYLDGTQTVPERGSTPISSGVLKFSANSVSDGSIAWPLPIDSYNIIYFSADSFNVVIAGPSFHNVTSGSDAGSNAPSPAPSASSAPR